MLATVISTTDAVQAHIIRGRLAVEGLHPSLAFEHHVWLNWFISNAIGGVRIQVPPSETEQASEVVQKINQDHYLNILEEAEQTRDDLHCPKCGSLDIKRSRFTESLALVLLCFMTLPIPFQTGAYVCQSCKHRWVSQDGKGTAVLLSLLAIFLAWMIYAFLELMFYLMCHANHLSPACY